MSEKLGFSFHRGLPLRRASIAQVLHFACEAASTNKRFDYKSVWEGTSLGSVDAQAACRWAYGFGLLDEDYQTTRFGTLAFDHDSGLSELNTQWLLHYHFVAPYRSGAEYWKSVVKGLHPQKEYTSETLSQEIKSLFFSNDNANERTIRQSASVLLGAYATTDGLGALGILAQDGNRFEVREPSPVDWKVAAYILADYWEHTRPNQVTMNYMDLMGEEGPATYLIQNSAVMSDLLTEIRDHGLIEIERTVRPWQVKRLFPNANVLLERVYE